MKPIFKPGVLVQHWLCCCWVAQYKLPWLKLPAPRHLREPRCASATWRIGAELPTTFVVKFEVTGMEVVPAGQNVPDSGHHHLLIDVNEIANASQPLPATNNIIHYGKGQTEAEITLPPGKHTLQLMFADYQHMLFDPVVMSEQIDITVIDDSKEANK